MSIKIDNALIQNFIDGAYGLSIAHENIDFSPTAGSPYAELLVLPNQVGMVTPETNSTTGVFRIILRYPAGKTAVVAKTMADTIQADYPVHGVLTYSGQSVKIMSAKREPSDVPEEGWYKLVITFGYQAFIQR